MLSHTLTATGLALATLQAGGGGSFGGGSSGGGFSGGGGGGDGMGSILYFLIRLAFEAPLIGVPLLIVVVVIFIKGSRKGWSKHQDRVIRRHRPQVQRRDSKRLADDLRRSDPSFDGQRMLERVERAFRVAQSSWCEQNLDPLRHFVTDGVYERFSLQIEEQRLDGWRQGMQSLSCGPLSIVHVDSGRLFETVTIQIPFRANIHRLALKDGSQITGSKLPRNHFSECWSFVRRRGAKTVSGEGLIEGHCPHCGAPLEVRQSARCGSCDSLVRSGQFDWVLAEITQTSEWRAEPELSVIDAFSKKDPGISTQLLEDRTSVAFWRKVAADRQGSPEALVRIADEAFCASFEQRVERDATGERSYITENAVGSVRTLGLLEGREKDRAVIEILSDGCRAHNGAGGKRVVESRRSLRRQLFVLQRPTGARTDIEESFTSSRCRTCGAHDAGGTDPLCPYCQSPRVGDPANWMLHEVLLDGSPAARSLRRELSSPKSPGTAKEAARAPASTAPSSADLLGWAVGMLRADGVLEPREQRALESLAQRSGSSAARVTELLAEQEEAAIAPQPRDSYEARSWLGTLVELAQADGNFHRQERKFLVQVAKHLGVGSIELNRIVRRTRSRLYRDARSV